MAARRTMQRIAAVQWLRKTHRWIGLWGATLGLLFGISGIWLNHRAVLQLPPVAQQRSNLQLALPDPAPPTAAALAEWLQGALELPRPAASVRVEPARPVPWIERGAGAPASDHAERLMQPERWTINFGGPQATIQVETWAGNRSVSVRRIDNGLIGTLMNMHKGVGMPVAWILVVDTLAGSLILLSLSGVALWIMTQRRRLLGYLVIGTAMAAIAGLALVRP
ncbi:MAG: PepSY-associated TM helix domain-containing protein [Proteobacteria bacterium]|nr:PepSY-associated TM helix domain-containing protein [Pseudomonadota bacterium]